LTLIVNAEPDGYCDAARGILAGLGRVVDGPFDRSGLIQAVADADVLIVRLGHHIDKSVLDVARKLRVIVSATTGVDHIDEAEAARKGITVLTLRGEVAFLETLSATAEHTWALLLALVRRLPAATHAARLGQWERDRFRGRELRGKRLGILGLGRLGHQVARYGIAFGMSVAAYDPKPRSWADGVIRCQSAAELFGMSDIVSIHVPLHYETRAMVSDDLLARMPRGAFLINTARGDIVDETALIASLKSGRLAGAALDVISGEVGGRLADSPTIRYAADHDNLILTPHIGGATYESMAATEIFMAKKLAAFLDAGARLQSATQGGARA
jgi:D-3-phosphoglycerate dehydrogenase